MGVLNSFTYGKRPEYRTFFSISTSYLAVQTFYPIISVPTSGESIYLTDVVLSAGNVSAGTFTLYETGSVKALDPIGVAVGAMVSIKLDVPIKVSTDSSLSITTEGFSGTHTVIISGYKL